SSHDSRSAAALLFSLELAKPLARLLARFLAGELRCLLQELPRLVAQADGLERDPQLVERVGEVAAPGPARAGLLVGEDRLAVALLREPGVADQELGPRRVLVEAPLVDVLLEELPRHRVLAAIVVALREIEERALVRRPLDLLQAALCIQPAQGLL